MKKYIYILIGSAFLCSVDTQAASLLAPLTSKVKEMMSDIGYIGLAYSVAMLYARQIAHSIFGFVATILLLNLDNIIAGLK